jgi:hypothetical protein
MVDEHLDTSKAFSNQEPNLVKAVCDAVSRFDLSILPCSHSQQAVEKFPGLMRYSGHWPVFDLMKMHLKATSSRRRHQVRFAVSQMAEPGRSNKKV